MFGMKFVKTNAYFLLNLVVLSPMVFLEYFGFPLSISFHRCSITRKNERKLIIIFISVFITGLHNKPSGCGASVSSTAGPF
jgi:hypothetical protein